jgi:uncharacterized protein (DUF302 family)/effector-binding domain-containing protein
MSYQIEITDTVPGTVFELHRTVRPGQVGPDIGAGLAELYSKAEVAGLHPAGPPTVTYLDPLLPGKPMNVDLGVAVVPGTGHAEIEDTARIIGRHSQPVARTVHHGDYTGIGAAHEALAEWIFTHGYRSAGPPTETYLAGPDTVPDPTDYRTEVSIPVVPSIGLSVQVSDDFATTVERTRKALRDNGFGVLTEIDLRAALRERIGTELEDFLILGVCDPNLAKRALDADRQAGLLLPCTVAVRTDGDHTVVEALDPAILVRTTGLAELQPVATEARERLTAALASLRTGAQPWTT